MSVTLPSTAPRLPALRPLRYSRGLDLSPHPPPPPSRPAALHLCPLPHSRPARPGGPSPSPAPSRHPAVSPWFPLSAPGSVSAALRARPAKPRPCHLALHARLKSSLGGAPGVQVSLWGPKRVLPWGKRTPLRPERPGCPAPAPPAPGNASTVGCSGRRRGVRRTERPRSPGTGAAPGRENGHGSSSTQPPPQGRSAFSPRPPARRGSEREPRRLAAPPPAPGRAAETPGPARIQGRGLRKGVPSPGFSAPRPLRGTVASASRPRMRESGLLSPRRASGRRGAARRQHLTENVPAEGGRGLGPVSKAPFLRRVSVAGWTQQ